jgi:hypothetical protein
VNASVTGGERFGSSRLRARFSHPAPSRSDIVTDPHPLFRLVWRLNALVILGVGLVAGLVAAWALLQIVRDVVRPRVLDGVMHAPQAERSEVITLGGFDVAPGGRYLVAPVQGEQTGEVSVYSKTSGSTRDLVVIDRQTGTVARVLSRVDRVILTWQYPVADRATPADPPLLLVTVVDADTDGNGRLDGNDSRTLLGCAPSGQPCTPLLTGVDHVLSLSARADGRVDVATTTAGKTEWRVINPDRTITDPVPVFPTP